jgi:hypothetical protein
MLEGTCNPGIEFIEALQDVCDALGSERIVASRLRRA